MKITAANLEGATDTIERMTITHSENQGGAIIHHGHIDGKPVSVINTYLGDGLSFIIKDE